MTIEKFSLIVKSSIANQDQIPSVLRRLGFMQPQATLVLVGGAGGMSEDLIAQTRAFFRDHIAPFVIENDLAVVDGGTNSGIMQAMGQARASHGANFPLIGVVVEKLVRDEPTLIEPNHSHLILTLGSDWGEEVPFLHAIPTQLAGSAPSMTLLFNGGQITWMDAQASVEQKRMVLVADGSGRAADSISKTSTGQLLEPRAVTLLRTGLIRISNPFTQPETFMGIVRETFGVA